MRNRKLISLLLVLAFTLLAFAGCAPTATEEPTTAPETTAPAQTETEPTAPPAEAYKVALVMTGVINDAGWTESAYNGLMLAQEQLGVEGAYSESVLQPDFESVMRDYASQGYDLVIAVGNEFSDAALVVAPDFLDTKFAVMNGNNFQEPNVAAYRFNTPQTGFIAGVCAALYSKTGVVGMIGGTTLPHIVDAVDAFAAGAKYINPDIKVLTGFTESMTDVAKGKEMGMTYIEQGADVLSANANSCGLGVIEAAKDKGIRHIGYVSDQNQVAPDTIMVSAIQSNEFLIMAIVKAAMDNEMTAALHLFGMAEGAISLSDFHGHEADLPEGGKAKIDAVIAGILDGSLKAQGILPKSTFEK
ncbi:MAG: BMP family protein [Bacillota bacterium]